MKFIIALLAWSSLGICENLSTQKPFIFDQEKENIENYVLKQAANRIYKQTGLIPIGSGGQTSNGVEMLALNFQYKKLINYEAAVFKNKLY